MRAPSIDYQTAQGASLGDALSYAEGLMHQLTDFGDPTVLSLAMYNAQVTSLSSPFVSVSRSRHVARQFAAGGGNPGFLLTITGPESHLYDFEGIREILGIPHRVEFQWMGELGIPFSIQAPFEIVRVDRIDAITEKSVRVYQKS